MVEILKTAIVILNYNDFKNTSRFVKEIKDYKSIDKILLVDNLSPNGDLEYLKTLEGGKIEVISSEKNGGYSYGNNFGVKHLGDEYDNIIISNPDVSVEEKAIIDSIKKLNSRENIAVVAPRMKFTSGFARRSSWKIRTYPLDLIHTTRLLELLFYPVLRSGEYSEKDYAKGDLKVDCIAGSFFIIKSKVLKEIDYFDENVFLFYEEDIIGKKLKEKGYEIYSLNDIHFMHYESQTIGKVFSYGKKISMLNKSKIYFQTKYNKINILQKLLLYILILCRNIELLVEIPARKLIQFIKSKKKIEKKS